MKRSQFLKTAGVASIVLPVAPLFSMTNGQEGPKLDPKIVQEFVGKSHRDTAGAKALLEAHPTLLNAAHDWKHGDFETGLGAASHVGNKELAKFLIEKGAQANIFTAALFGQMAIVKAMLSFSPKLIHSKGPHGFTALHHAKVGGEDAVEVKEYLMSLGAKESKIALY